MVRGDGVVCSADEGGSTVVRARNAFQSGRVAAHTQHKLHDHRCSGTGTKTNNKAVINEVLVLINEVLVINLVININVVCGIKFGN